MDTSSTSSLQETLVFDFMQSRPTQTSFTLDVLNASVLKDETIDAFGGTLPGILLNVDPLRFRGDFSRQDAVWGFKESFSRGGEKGISSSVVLTGERIIIYIATKGHGVGYTPWNGGTAVFTTTSLEISLVDPVRGVEKTIEFSDFDAEEDDPGRYIEWVVPEYDSTFGATLESKKLNGVYFIKIKENSSFYENPGKTSSLDLSYANHSFVHCPAYWWKKAIAYGSVDPYFRNIMGLIGMNIIQDPIPLNGEDRATVFDARTRLALYPNDLTEEQKSVIMDDHALWYLSSQLATLPIDSPVSPLLYAGIQPKPPSTSPTVPSARPNAFPDVVPAEVSRRFSLEVSPVASNLMENLFDYDSDGTHSLLYFYKTMDPSSTICLNKIGQVEDKMGDDGLDFSGTTIDLLHADIPVHSGYVKLQTTLDDAMPGVDNLTISVYDDKVTIAFVVNENAELISSVSYKVGIDDWNDTINYTDPTGVSRTHTLDVSYYDKSITSTCTINAQVVVHTIDNQTYFFRATKSMAVDSSGIPSIPFIQSCEQRDGSGVIQIQYDYLNTTNIAPASVTIQANQVYNGATDLAWEDITQYCYGDCGYGNTVIPGSGKTIYVSLINLPTTSALRSGLGDPFPVLKFRVYLTDPSGRTALAETGLAVSISKNNPAGIVARAYNQNKEYYTLDPAVTVEPSGTRFGKYYPMDIDQSISSVEDLICTSSSSGGTTSSESSESKQSSSSLSSSSPEKSESSISSSGSSSSFSSPSSSTLSTDSTQTTLSTDSTQTTLSTDSTQTTLSTDSTQTTLSTDSTPSTQSDVSTQSTLTTQSTQSTPSSQSFYPMMIEFKTAKAKKTKQFKSESSGKIIENGIGAHLL